MTLDVQTSKGVARDGMHYGKFFETLKSGWL
jgi:hypothetical protein